MSSALPAQLREQVLARAAGRCAYCQSAEEWMGIAFEIDHIIPQSVGGKTSLDNLCLSCPTCNRHKAARLTAQDPISQDQVPLFHPLKQAWNHHFAWSDDGTRVIGLTPTGRATIQALRMNRPAIVQLRRYWVALNTHPPR
jgi:5-methylcytosine-specific restriction endonuclease McrA